MSLCRQYLVVAILSVSQIGSLPATYNFTLDDFFSINNLGAAPRSLERSGRRDVLQVEATAQQTHQSVGPNMYLPLPRSSRDLALSESGYIFRSDDHSPPMLIKLGAADDSKFNNMLKKAGISMPPDGITYSSPPYESNQKYHPVVHEYDSNGYKSKPHWSEGDSYTKPQGVERDGYTKPHGSERAGYAKPHGSERDGYTKPHGSERDGYTKPLGSERDGYTKPDGLERDSQEAVRSYSPTSEGVSSGEFEDFKLNPVALAPSSSESSGEQDTPLHSQGSRVGKKPSITEDEVSYTYTQEPIRFEYVSHSADDDGYEELLRRLHGDGNRGESGGDNLEEVYRPPISNGKPLYENTRTFEGFDQGAPSFDLNLESKSGLSKSFIAPIFELPSTYDTSFERHTAPIKYKLNKKPKYTAPIQSDQPLEEHADEHEHDHDFEKDGGSSYDTGHHGVHGHSHDKGYKDYNEFNTKEKSKYDKAEDKGFYNGKDGQKKHHYNEGDKYGEHHNKKKGVKGSKFGESGYHKKGHKTNGYHNIFHKDEFKKEHKFYDDAKKEGFFDKYGNYHKKSGQKKGGKDGKGFHQSGYDSSHSGKDGLYDKGFLSQEHKGHDGKSGHSSGFANFEDVDKKYGEEKKYGGYADGLSHR